MSRQAINDEEPFGEDTPLLSTCSLPTMLTGPLPIVEHDKQQADQHSLILNIEERETLPIHASTSQSVEELNRTPNRQCAHATKLKCSSRKCRKRRRIHSDTDLSKPRPLIMSPFMPTYLTQVSIEGQERRRTNTNITPDSNSQSFIIAPRIIATTQPGKPGGHSKYESIHLEKKNAYNQVQQTILEGEHESEVDEEESGSSSSSSSYVRFSELTKKQWATIAMLAIANLCSTVAFSCIAPFYPDEAKDKGMNTTEVGIVFGIFELVMFVTAPVLGKYMALIGSKFMFIMGVFITGITAVAFGTLNLLPSGSMFFWFSLLIRCIESLGDACFVTSSFAISAKCFPGRIATIVGIMETFAGLGYTAGPVIGGVLYEYGGFQMPFFVLGIFLLLATVLSYFLIEEIGDEPTEDAMDMLSMLKIPEIWMMVFAVIICAISLSFFDPTLSGHLASFNLSTTMVGLMFLLCGGFYCVTAPLWGFILDRWRCCNVLMLFGSSATILSMLLIGPSPLLNLEKNLVLIGVSLAVLGISAGALYIPTFQNCLDSVKENGYDDSFQTYGCVSGVFQSAFALGAFLGPTLGGFSVETVGFPYTTTFIAGINILFICVLVTFFIIKRLIRLNIESKSKRSLSLDT